MDFGGKTAMMNNTAETQYHCHQTIQTMPSSILPPAIIIVFLLGLPVNVTALYVFCRNLRSWKPSVLFLFNLVISDLLLLLSLPFRIHYYWHKENWVFGSAWCGINLFMIAINRSASISFMSALTVDRYFKIVHPHHKMNYMSLCQAGGIMFLIWTVVLLLRIPLLTHDLLIEHQNITFCRSFIAYKAPPLAFKIHYAVFICEFFFALIILLFCSLRIFCFFYRRQLDRRVNIRRAIRTVQIIVFVFIICFCPGVAIGLSAIYLKSLGESYCKEFDLTGQLFVTSIALTYLNALLDPLIYGFSSSMFRDALAHSIKRIRRRK